MYSFKSIKGFALACAVLLVSRSFASTDSIGPNGISSVDLVDFNGVPLTGAGIDIGQVELDRPGDPDFDTVDAIFHSSVNPTEVFYRDPGPPLSFSPTMNDPLGVEINEHAVWVAGVILSTETGDPDMDGDSPTGVAQGADLYSVGYNPFAPPGPSIDDEVAISAQHLAALPSVDIRAINMSFAIPLDAPTHILDGNQHLTQFIDWSADHHDILYVIAGNESSDSSSVPTDNFNSVVIATSGKVAGSGKYRQVALRNRYNQDAEGVRTSIDLLAPGESIKTPDLGNTTTVEFGTSLAAPHVTGTVALLQQYADERIMNAGAPHWKPDPPNQNAPARRHEVMKAVLMNSADKLEDNGDGMRLGMSRTVLDQNGDDWLDSDAYANPGIPLDVQMGAGHLNARRALQQFAPGEHDAVNPTGTTVPQIGWDYGNVNDTGSFLNEYVFADPLPAGSFVSITLAWDRLLSLDTDTGTMGAYDPGDTFEVAGDFDEGFNDLDIYLLPQGAVDITEAIAQSNSAASNLEHLFFQIPTTGMYEFWVYEFGGPISLNDTDYAVAWWAFNGPTGPGMTGDYNGDTVVDINDYNAWRSSFGSTTNLDADGNDDQVINAADYVIWRDNLGAGSGSGSLAAVPEPSSLLLLALAAIFFIRRSPQQ